MSRKWERMVEKNRKTVDKARKKSGQAPVGEVRSDSGETVIKGRSWMLPSFLVLFSLFYFISSYNIMPHNGTYWFTGLSYIFLGLLIWLIRRPVIKVGRNTIAVRRFSGDRYLEPKDIESLTLNPGHVVIELKGNNKKWMYTRLQHLFPMELLNAKLKAFAEQHRITIKE